MKVQWRLLGRKGGWKEVREDKYSSRGYKYKHLSMYILNVLKCKKETCLFCMLTKNII